MLQSAIGSRTLRLYALPRPDQLGWRSESVRLRAQRPQEARQLTRSHGLLAHGASARGPVWLARASSSHEAKSLQGLHAARQAVSSHPCEGRRGGGGTGEVAASYRRPAPSRTRLSRWLRTAGAQPLAQMLALSSAGVGDTRARLCCHARCHATHPTPHAPQPPPRPLHASSLVQQAARV